MGFTQTWLGTNTRLASMAKGSHNSWGPAEKQAAKACPGCGKRVTLEQGSVSETIVSTGTTTVWHTSCRNLGLYGTS